MSYSQSPKESELEFTSTFVNRSNSNYNPSHFFTKDEHSPPQRDKPSSPIRISTNESNAISKHSKAISLGKIFRRDIPLDTTQLSNAYMNHLRPADPLRGSFSPLTSAQNPVTSLQSEVIETKREVETLKNEVNSLKSQLHAINPKPDFSNFNRSRSAYKVYQPNYKPSGSIVTNLNQHFYHSNFVSPQKRQSTTEQVRSPTATKIQNLREEMYKYMYATPSTGHLLRHQARSSSAAPKRSSEQNRTEIPSYFSLTPVQGSEGESNRVSSDRDIEKHTTNAEQVPTYAGKAYFDPSQTTTVTNDTSITNTRLTNNRSAMISTAPQSGDTTPTWKKGRKPGHITTFANAKENKPENQQYAYHTQVTFQTTESAERNLKTEQSAKFLSPIKENTQKKSPEMRTPSSKKKSQRKPAWNYNYSPPGYSTRPTGSGGKTSPQKRSSLNKSPEKASPSRNRLSPGSNSQSNRGTPQRQHTNSDEKMKRYVTIEQDNPQHHSRSHLDDKENINNLSQHSVGAFQPVYPHHDSPQNFPSQQNNQFQFFNGQPISNPYANMQNYFMFLTGFYNFHMNNLRSILNKQNETISEQFRRMSTYEGDFIKCNHHINSIEDRMKMQEAVYNSHLKEMQARYEKAVQNLQQFSEAVDNITNQFQKSKQVQETEEELKMENLLTELANMKKEISQQRNNIRELEQGKSDLQEQIRQIESIYHADELATLNPEKRKTITSTLQSYRSQNHKIGQMNREILEKFDKTLNDIEKIEELIDERSERRSYLETSAVHDLPRGEYEQAGYLAKREEEERMRLSTDPYDIAQQDYHRIRNKNNRTLVKNLLNWVPTQAPRNTIKSILQRPQGRQSFHDDTLTAHLEPRRTVFEERRTRAPSVQPSQNKSFFQAESYDNIEEKVKLIQTRKKLIEEELIRLPLPCKSVEQKKRKAYLDKALEAAEFELEKLREKLQRITLY